MVSAGTEFSKVLRRWTKASHRSKVCYAQACSPKGQDFRYESSNGPSEDTVKLHIAPSLADSASRYSMSC